MYNSWHEVGQWLKSIGIEVAFMIAGVMGGVMNLNKEKKKTLGEKIISIISGGAVANYLTPVIVGFLNISDNAKFGIAFVVGYLGLKSVEMVIEKVQEKMKPKKADPE